MIGVVGVAPEKYWSYTMRENGLLAKAHQAKEENSWAMTRNIEFSNYNTTFSFGNGKKIFRDVKSPKDLYKLPSEIEKKRQTTAVFDLQRAEEAYAKTIKQ